MIEDKMSIMLRQLQRDAVQRAWDASPAKGKALAKLYGFTRADLDLDGPIEPQWRHVRSLLKRGLPAKSLFRGPGVFSFRVVRKRGNEYAIFKCDNAGPSTSPVDAGDKFAL